jgi:hypothetical protein
MVKSDFKRKNAKGKLAQKVFIAVTRSLRSEENIVFFKKYRKKYFPNLRNFFLSGS